MRKNKTSNQRKIAAFSMRGHIVYNHGPSTIYITQVIPKKAGRFIQEEKIYFTIPPGQGIDLEILKLLPKPLKEKEK